MDKKKSIISAVICLIILAVGITIGFFIGKGTAQDVSAEITTTTEETTEAPSEAEKTTEETTDETTQEETTTKAAEYTEVNEIVYATTNVNIRSGAGTSAAIIGGLKKGDRIKRTAVGDNGWSRVSYNGKTAYVFSNYLTKNSSGSGIDMCGISNTDAQNLTALLEYFFFHGMESYNYKAENAFEKAFSIIHGTPYYSLCDLVGEIYRFSYENSVIFPEDSEEDITDPRGYWKQFRIVEAEFVDFILGNMFNVKPDHKYILYSEYWFGEGENNIYAYYEDGYYYSDAGDGGDGCGPDVKVKKVEILPDGRYQVTVHYRIVSGDEIVEDCGDMEVVAEMKNIDGSSIWSFYEIKQVK